MPLQTTVSCVLKRDLTESTDLDFLRRIVQLSSQVALIARDYGLPSVAGVCVYVDIGYGTAPHDVIQTVRATKEAWATLWRPYLSAEAVTLQLRGSDHVLASTCGSAQANYKNVAIAGRIEFDIDLRRARWFCEWCSPSSGHLSAQRNHPSESTRHRTSSTFSEMALEPSKFSGFDALASTPNASPSVSKLSYTRGTSTACSPYLSVSHSPPRPEALPASLLPIQVDSEKKDPNWTEQLNQLREIREHDLVEGLDHPSQIDSLDGTQSLSEIYAALTSTESSEHHPALAVDVPQIAKVSHPLPSMLGPQSSPKYRTEYPTLHWYESGLYNPVHQIVIVPPARDQEKIQHAVLSPALDNKQTNPPATCNARRRRDDTEAFCEGELPSKLMKPSERVCKRTKVRGASAFDSFHRPRSDERAYRNYPGATRRSNALLSGPLRSTTSTQIRSNRPRMLPSLHRCPRQLSAPRHRSLSREAPVRATLIFHCRRQFRADACPTMSRKSQASCAAPNALSTPSQNFRTTTKMSRLGFCTVAISMSSSRWPTMMKMGVRASQILMRATLMRARTGVKSLIFAQ